VGKGEVGCRPFIANRSSDRHRLAPITVRLRTSQEVEIQTTLDRNDDYDREFAAARRQADRTRDRALQLATAPGLGIPPEGSGNVLLRDPLQLTTVIRFLKGHYLPAQAPRKQPPETRSVAHRPGETVRWPARESVRFDRDEGVLQVASASPGLDIQFWPAFRPRRFVRVPYSSKERPPWLKICRNAL
jgi:hypothetical protein